MFKTLKFKRVGGYTGSAKRLGFAACAMSVLGFGFFGKLIRGR
jgi:hypothetical protein